MTDQATKQRKYYKAHRNEILARRKVLANRVRHNERRRMKRDRRRERYGISNEEFLSQLKKQNFACALCLALLDKNSRNQYLDHDHATKRIRGILCPRCNTLVGYLETTPKDLLEKAHKYIASSNFTVPIEADYRREFDNRWVETPKVRQDTNEAKEFMVRPSVRWQTNGQREDLLPSGPDSGSQQSDATGYVDTTILPENWTEDFGPDTGSGSICDEPRFRSEPSGG